MSVSFLPQLYKSNPACHTFYQKQHTNFERLLCGIYVQLTLSFEAFFRKSSKKND